MNIGFIVDASNKIGFGHWSRCFNLSKILKAELANGKGEKGNVLNDYLEIGCGNNKSIKILRIQRQGKRPQNTGEFMLGSQIKKGSNLNNA